jgi:uncharacterized RDD family membrane protein YckC
LSTLVSQPVATPSWKEEVNRRLEAHKSRRGISVVDQNAPRTAPVAVSSRAALAAARVAARYAQAPSFSEMQAAEARAALRAAEAATRVALEAQAAAQAALANLAAAEEEDEACIEAEVQLEGVTISPHAQMSISVAEPQIEIEPATAPEPPAGPLQVRWEPDMPVRPVAPAAKTHYTVADDLFSGPATDSPIEPVEPAQAIPANLIQFPRELVASRRMRPRLAGASPGGSADSSGQLSIFEVDPDMISTEPAPVAEAAPAPSWSGPDWSRIELDSVTLEDIELETDQNPAGMPAALELAPLGLRLMAFAVDLALVVGIASAAAAVLAHRLQQLPPVRSAEMMALGLVALTGVLYHLGFLLTMRSTPGMRYAGLAVCTFDDEHPTRAQLRDRLLAMLVSVLPVGLGLAWSAFDENHLSWHDRLSRTYLRKC